MQEQQDKKRIRIVKREARIVSAGTQGSVKRPANSVVKVVSSWVGELRRKKAEEARIGFDQLFGNAG